MTSLTTYIRVPPESYFVYIIGNEEHTFSEKEKFLRMGETSHYQQHYVQNDKISVQREIL